MGEDLIELDHILSKSTTNKLEVEMTSSPADHNERSNSDANKCREDTAKLSEHYELDTKEHSEFKEDIPRNFTTSIPSTSHDGKRSSTSMKSLKNMQRNSTPVLNDSKLRTLFASSHPRSDFQQQQVPVHDITLFSLQTANTESSSPPKTAAFETQSSSQQLLTSGNLGPAIGQCVPVTAVEPGPVWPTGDQLYVAKGYGVQRTDGTYTSLVRADLLPSEVQLYLGIPDRQGPEGLIIVPKPLQPARAVHPIPMVHTSLIARLPRNGTELNQVKITVPSIITSQTDANTTSVTPVHTTSNVKVSHPPRQIKIYCDKWIHNGTCAFTQVGCRYKHEMPTDMATLRSLGLRGIPNWYRQAHAVILRDSSITATRSSPPFPPTYRQNTNQNMTEGSAYGVGPWHRNSSRFQCSAMSPNNNSISGMPQPTVPDYGPIARPSQNDADAIMSIETA